jgi:hypothetical protein
VPLSAEQKTNLKADIEALKTWVSAEGHE